MNKTINEAMASFCLSFAIFFVFALSPLELVLHLASAWKNISTLRIIYSFPVKSSSWCEEVLNFLDIINLSNILPKFIIINYP